MGDEPGDEDGETMATTTTLPRRRRRTTVLTPDQVVDDETLHPGVVVWLAARRLDDVERAHFHDPPGHADTVRRTAMRDHPSAGRPTLRVV